MHGADIPLLVTIILWFVRSGRMVMMRMFHWYYKIKSNMVQLFCLCSTCAEIIGTCADRSSALSVAQVSKHSIIFPNFHAGPTQVPYES
jgi:hypothetical protein